MRLWPDKKSRRTQLCVPADKPHMIKSALASDADCIILDLEDGVAPDKKKYARKKLLETLEATDFGNKEVIVRVNARDTPYYEADMNAIAAHAKVHAISLPKIESEADIKSASDIAPEKCLWLAFETPKGIFNIRDILRNVSQYKVGALQFGNNDFSAEIGTAASQVMIHARSEIVLGARANGLMVFDGPSRSILETSTPEENPVFRQAKNAFDLGFDGTVVIHPSQIASANRVFTPTAENVEHAKRITASCLQEGAGRIGQEMIEALHVRQARETLAIAESISANDRFR